MRKKGFITEAQLQNDEFAVKQAEQELQLALGKTNEAKLGADLVLMTAEQDLLQAQRNYFGAHTYERVDRPRGQFFHTDWTGSGGDTTSTPYIT